MIWIWLLTQWQIVLIPVINSEYSFNEITHEEAGVDEETNGTKEAQY